MTKIISLSAARKMKELNEEDLAYRAKILCMSKFELLDEMIRFQEERSQCGTLTLSLINKGKVLFKALEENAETNELKILSKSYRKHLEFEHQEMLKVRH